MGLIQSLHSSSRHFSEVGSTSLVLMGQMAFRAGDEVIVGSSGDDGAELEFRNVTHVQTRPRPGGACRFSSHTTGNT